MALPKGPKSRSVPGYTTCQSYKLVGNTLSLFFSSITLYLNNTRKTQPSSFKMAEYQILLYLHCDP